jgi:fucose 4-O-acetylase-like acetyltransferase
MERIEAFDILKGIGIILMIVAHTYGPNNMIWDYIYAFHMPLFFIVTGYFYKQRPIAQLLKSNYSQLLLPYIAICIIVSILTQIRESHEILIDIDKTLNGMGPGWFLLAMFLARFELHFILRVFPNSYLSISLLISIIICFIANKLFFTSFISFFPSLAGLFFISAGYYIKQNHLLDFYNRNHLRIPFICLLLWIITSLYGKVELSQCVFKLSFIDFAGSLGGTIFFFWISQIIEKNTIHLKHILSATGRYSLIILFFHCIDYCVPIWYLVSPHIPPYLLLPIILVLRLLFVSICVMITLRIKILRLFFGI